MFESRILKNIKTSTERMREKEGQVERKRGRVKVVIERTQI